MTLHPVCSVPQQFVGVLHRSGTPATPTLGLSIAAINKVGKSLFAILSLLYLVALGISSQKLVNISLTFNPPNLSCQEESHQPEHSKGFYRALLSGARQCDPHLQQFSLRQPIDKGCQGG